MADYTRNVSKIASEIETVCGGSWPNNSSLKGQPRRKNLWRESVFEKRRGVINSFELGGTNFKKLPLWEWWEWNRGSLLVRINNTCNFNFQHLEMEKF